MISRIQHFKQIFPQVLRTLIVKLCGVLGHLSECITARFQFALLVLLKDVLGLNSDKVFLCDPILYEEEREIIKTQNA